MTSTTATGVSISPSRLPRPAAILALARRDLLIYTSYRLMMTLDLWIGALDVIVYYFISQTFEGPTTASLGGAPSYFAFALVGIAVTVVIQAASGGIANKVREEQLTGTLEALAAQPLTTTELATGLCGLPFAISAFRVAVYIVLGAVAFGLDLSHTDWAGFVAMLVATALAMSSVGIGTAALVLVVKRGATISGLVIFAMSLAGGAFFPVAVLPDWLEAIGKVVPPKFAFDGFRSALFVGSDWEDDALILTAFSLVALPVSVWLFGRGMLYARRAGSLAQY
jgi:ABC-2 type transport system permease protein